MQRDLGNRLRGKRVEVDTGAVLERLGVLEKRNLDFKFLCGLEYAGRGQRHASRQLFQLHSGQVQRGALPGHGLVRHAAVYLDATHARTFSRRKNLDFLFLLHFAGDQRAGYNGAKAFHGEYAVDGQAEKGLGVARGDFGGEAHDFALQFVEPSPLERADRNDGRPAGVEKRSADEVFYLHADDAERVFIHQVGFGDHGDAARNGEQPADFKMLARLRLDGFVGGDHHQHQVDAAHAGQHVAHKALMAGNVDETELKLGFVFVASLQTACDFCRLRIVLRLC